MFTNYVQDVMNKLAVYELIKDNEPYYASIKGFSGVWAQGKTLKECEESLRDVLEEWLILRIRKKKFIPTTRKFNLNSLLAS